MDREKWIEWMQRDLDGDLTQVEKEMLEKHLARSPEDARIYEGFRSLSDELSRLPQVMPPTSMVDSLLAEMEDKPSESRPNPSGWMARWRPSRRVAVGMAALFVVGFVSGAWVNGWLMSDPPKQTMTSRGDGSPFDGKNASKVPPDVLISMSSEKDGQSHIAFSPDREYQAIWTDNHLLVKTKDAKTTYSQKLSVGGQKPRMQWVSARRVKVSYQDEKGASKQLTIDVERGEKVN
ncbi:putative zinc finger protein [Laceyella sediminis]|jgi:Putative zinc-finger|uniref:Zinc-finger n=2 Tax=Laceyella TaxID=292635 RepID=A0AA45WM27_9BACL|nr:MULTISPECIES: zf-HC2 domain-containing protein [Laceyella]PRZ17171.1 putative zinc finger protein [Laceyella sediminis]SMP12913.1 Putative zinc-finger [Laceyella tengchongensis]